MRVVDIQVLLADGGQERGVCTLHACVIDELGGAKDIAPIMDLACEGMPARGTHLILITVRNQDQTEVCQYALSAADLWSRTVRSMGAHPP